MLGKVLSISSGAVAGVFSGGVCGVVAGLIHAPVVAGLALTAPLSYPVLGAGIGVACNEFSTPGQSALFGLGVGVCLIPIAPINFMMAPLTPVIHGVTGMLAGGVGGAMAGAWAYGEVTKDKG